MAGSEELIAESGVIEVTPVKESITCGIGIPMMKMRDPAQARACSGRHLVVGGSMSKRRFKTSRIGTIRTFLREGT